MKSSYRLLTAASSDLPLKGLVIGMVVGVLCFAAAQESTGFTLPAWSDIAGWDDPSCYSTIQMADLDGDGYEELVGRCSAGIAAYRFDTSSGVWTSLPPGPNFSNKHGWNAAKYYKTIQTADLDGDGQVELFGRGSAGMVVYKFEKTSSNTGSWKLLTPTQSGPFPNQEGWDAPKYYETIQTADLDGDGQAELFGRGSAGMVVYKFDSNTGSWKLLTPTQSGPFPNREGWDAPEYYETIQTADLDGDGRAELIGRGPAGIVTYKFDSNTGSWKLLTPTQSGPFPNWKSWDAPEYYETIQTADLDGDGRAELFGRGHAGIVIYKFEMTSSHPGSWKLLPPTQSGPFPNLESWDAPEYYETIQTADLDGDGQAELFGRGSGGIVAYSYNEVGTWSRLPNGPGWSNSDDWNQARYYMTIQAGNFDPDQKGAELLARDSSGITAYSHREGLKGTWSPVEPVKAFPQFTGDKLTAYNAINSGLGLANGVTIRSLYAKKSAADLTTYKVDIGGLTRPRDVRKRTWATVTTQIEQELEWATYVASAFTSNQQLLTDTFLSQDLTLNYVAGRLKIDEDSSDEVTAVFSDLFSGVVDAIGIGTEKVAAEIITKLVASAIDAGTEAGMDDGTLSDKYNEIVGKIESNFQYAKNGNGDNRSTIATTYGLLATVGPLFESGTWNYPSPGAPLYQKASAAARKQYAIFLWRTLTPADWQIGGNCSSTDYAYEGKWMLVSGWFAGCVDLDLRELLFEPTSSDCQTTFTDSCSMGIPLEEVFLHWCIPGGSDIPGNTCPNS